MRASFFLPIKIRPKSAARKRREANIILSFNSFSHYTPARIFSGVIMSSRLAPYPGLLSFAHACWRHGFQVWSPIVFFVGSSGGDVGAEIGETGASMRSKAKEFRYAVVAHVGLVIVMNLGANLSIWAATKIGKNDLGIEMYDPTNGCLESISGALLGFGAGLAHSYLTGKSQ